MGTRPIRRRSRSSKRACELNRRCQCRPCPYLNNVLEQDHRFVKKRIAASLWFRSVDGALRTIAGSEAMNMIRKGQVSWRKTTWSGRSVSSNQHSALQHNNRGTSPAGSLPSEPLFATDPTKVLLTRNVATSVLSLPLSSSGFRLRIDSHADSASIDSNAARTLSRISREIADRNVCIRALGFRLAKAIDNPTFANR